MRLLRLEIRGFGQLGGSYPLEVGEGRIALLLEENESGKSTLAAAVIAALYGLESDRRKSRGRLSPTDRYRPWDQNPYGLSLVLQHEGEELVIERDFERATVRVLSGGEDVTQRFARGSAVAVGELLTGLRRNQFALSAFMGQGDLVWTDAADLSEALQRVTDSDAGGSTSAAAIDALDAALANYEGYSLKGRGRIETEIKRCEDRLAEDEEELARLEENRRALGAKIQTLAAAGERTALFDHLRRSLRARRTLQEVRGLETQLDADIELRQTIEDLEQRCAAETELRALDGPLLQKVANAKGAYQSELGAQKELNADAERREIHLKELEAEVAELSMTRRPTESDSDALLRVAERREFARKEIEKLEEEHEQEGNELRFLAIPVEEAMELTKQFEKLPQRDREFIARRTSIQQRQQEERQRLEEELSTRKRRRAELRRGQQLRKHFGIWCMVVGLLPIMLGIVMHPHLPFSSLYLHGAGALFLAVGIFSLVLGQTHGGAEGKSLTALVSKTRLQLGELGKDEQRASRQWNVLAEQLGFRAAQLEDRYLQFLAVERRVDTMRRLRGRVEQAESELRASVDELSEIWSIFGDEPDAERVIERRAYLVSALELYRQLDEASAAAVDARRVANEARVRVQLRREQLTSALRSAGVQVDADPLEQIPRFEERAEQASAAQKRFEQELPSLRERAMTDRMRQALEHQLTKLRGELQILREELQSHAHRGPEWRAGLASAEMPIDGDAYETERNKLEQQEKDSSSQSESDRVEARAFLQSYETAAPVLRERIDECRVALLRARQFHKSVNLARDTLASLAQATHRDWAALLNERSNEILRVMESEIQDIHFDESLRLRMQQRGKQLTASDAAAQLSVGALDMVYLAARLAVAQALSGDVSLPLILDDPFANADDKRLVRGMQLLLDALAPRQQVILMACQRSRYAWLRDNLSGDERMVALGNHARSENEG